MSQHILVIDLDSIEQAKLDAGEYVFPEHIDSRTYSIQCPDPKHCVGWMECNRRHICKHGHSAGDGFDENSEDGPCPGHDDDDLPNCFSGDEEFQFHGEWHTYRYGWGWTVRWPGCVVADADWDYGDVDGDRLPRGEYEVNDDWDDTSCSLELVDAA